MIPAPLTTTVEMTFRLLSLFLFTVSLSPAADEPVEGITFAANPGRIYLPIEEAASILGWDCFVDEKKKRVRLNGKSFDYWSLRRIIGGSRLVNLSNLREAGAVTGERSAQGEVKVTSDKGKEIILVPGKKRVLVDLEARRLKSWQGQRLVLDCHISAGPGRRTPAGSFTAGPYKSRYHYSSRYRNAPMPYSVQITGNIFVHGFRSVPDYPASRGCIRMHLDQGNPARFFYEWVDRGVPIRIVRETPGEENTGGEEAAAEVSSEPTG